MTRATAHPLRAIVARPSYLEETLECGHTINRPFSCGELMMEHSKVKRRRCYHCMPQVKQAPPRTARKNPARTFSIFVASDTEYRVKHGNRVVAKFANEQAAMDCLRAKATGEQP